MKNFAQVTFALMFAVTSLSAQLTVDFPIDKAVYQRSGTNQLDLLVAGTYTDTTATTVQARLLNAQTNAVIANFDWKTISASPILGHFRGFLNSVPGGWYKLEVRTLNNLVVLNTTQVSKVGVGEVFVVSGQSNAEGFLNLGAVAAMSERVVTHNYDDSTSYDQHTLKKPSFPSSSKIQSGSFLSLKGRSAWSYGRLGDLLTLRLGVPIAFFNGAAIGTSSKNWRESINMGDTRNEYTQTQYGIKGMPYEHLKIVLNYYANQFGARANLWHQGETDTYTNVTTNDYVTNMTAVRNQTRQDFHPDLSWVISRASYTAGQTSSAVIGGQNTLVQQGANSFYGPETDLIQNRAEDNVHFFAAGLIQLANAWDARLNTDFFANSKPVLPKPIQEVKYRLVNNEVWLIAQNNFLSYRWIKIINGNKDYENNPESTSALLKRTSGKYLCYLTEKNGNIIPSQVVDIDLIKQFYAKNPPRCETKTFLSDLNEIINQQGFKIDKTDSGGAIVLDGQTFAKGLGAHANSEINCTFPAGTYQRFKTFIGINDSITSANCPSNDGVVYKVYGNNLSTLLYVSDILRPESPIQYVDLDVSTFTKLIFVVESVGNINCDHADWGDAHFTNETLAPPVVAVNRSLINSGQTVTFAPTTNCSGGNMLRWSDGSKQTTYTTSFVSSNTYFATCVSPNSCQSIPSNTVTVTIVPDCASTYSFTSPANNISTPATNITYKVSTTINASNKISGNAKVAYDAKKSILLTPGFSVESGTTFTAKTGGCAN